MSTTTVAGEIRLKRLSPEYWRVTFDLPPLNIFGPANIPQLEEVVSLIETDEIVKETGRVGKVSTRPHRLASLAGHARAYQPRAGCLDRVDPWARYRRWQRTVSRVRHALCEP